MDIEKTKPSPPTRKDPPEDWRWRKTFSKENPVRPRPFERSIIGGAYPRLLPGERCVCGHTYSHDEYFSHNCPKQMGRWLIAEKVDALKTGREYWSTVFKRADAEGVWQTRMLTEPAGRGVREVYLVDIVWAIREWRNELRMDKARSRAGRHKYGDKLDNFIQSRLRIAQRGKDFCDNFRWAESTSRSQMRRYRRWQAIGCCGSYDAEIVDRDTGRSFMIGFNYGH